MILCLESKNQFIFILNMDSILQSLIESIYIDDIEEVQNFYKDYLGTKIYFLHFSTPKDIFIPIQSFLFDISVLKNSKKCINYIGNYFDIPKEEEESCADENIEESDDDPLKNAFVYNGEISEDDDADSNNQNIPDDEKSSNYKEKEFIKITDKNIDIIQLFLALSDFYKTKDDDTSENDLEYSSLIDWYSTSEFSTNDYPETIFDALYVASNTNILSIVEYLLYQGVDATRISKYGTTIFNGAVFRRNYDLIDLLYQYEVSQTSDGMGRFPLHMATKIMDEEMAGYLLEMGGDPSCIDNRTFTPLHLAAKIGCISIINLLIDYGALPSKRDRYGRTPLHIAALYGQLGSCKALYENGASMEAIDKHGLTPMNFATMRNKKKVVKFFESLGLNNTNIEKDYHNRPKRRPKKQQNITNNPKNKEMLKIIRSLR